MGIGEMKERVKAYLSKKVLDAKIAAAPIILRVGSKIDELRNNANESYDDLKQKIDSIKSHYKYHPLEQIDAYQADLDEFAAQNYDFPLVRLVKLMHESKIDPLGPDYSDVEFAYRKLMASRKDIALELVKYGFNSDNDADFFLLPFVLVNTWYEGTIKADLNKGLELLEKAATYQQRVNFGDVALRYFNEMLSISPNELEHLKDFGFAYPDISANLNFLDANGLNDSLRLFNELYFELAGRIPVSEILEFMKNLSEIEVDNYKILVKKSSSPNRLGVRAYDNGFIEDDARTIMNEILSGSQPIVSIENIMAKNYHPTQNTLRNQLNVIMNYSGMQNFANWFNEKRYESALKNASGQFGFLAWITRTDLRNANLALNYIASQAARDTKVSKKYQNSLDDLKNAKSFDDAIDAINSQIIAGKSATEKLIELTEEENRIPLAGFNSYGEGSFVERAFGERKARAYEAIENYQKTNFSQDRRSPITRTLEQIDVFDGDSPENYTDLGIKVYEEHQKLYASIEKLNGKIKNSLRQRSKGRFGYSKKQMKEDLETLSSDNYLAKLKVVETAAQHDERKLEKQIWMYSFSTNKIPPTINERVAQFKLGFQKLASNLKYEVRFLTSSYA